MEEKQVRAVIQALIERNDVRIGELRRENKTELRAQKRMENEIIIVELEHADMTLIELMHNLRLCDCPDKEGK